MDQETRGLLEPIQAELMVLEEHALRIRMLLMWVLER